LRLHRTGTFPAIAHKLVLVHRVASLLVQMHRAAEPAYAKE